MKTRSLSHILLACCAIAIPAHAADVCQTIGDATAKLWQIPVHIYLTQTAAFRGNQAKSSESIYAPGGAIYVMVNGKWTRSRATTTELKSARDEAKEKPKQQSCRYLRDEAVNGEAAAVYSEHAEYEDSKIDQTIWISKSRNVPLKSESDLDTGGTMGKSHSASRFEYSNVQAPAGVK